MARSGSWCWRIPERVLNSFRPEFAGVAAVGYGGHDSFPCVLYVSVNVGCDGVIELGDPCVGGVWALGRTFQKVFSPWEADVGMGRDWRGTENHLLRLTMIGRWSDLIVIVGSNLAPMTRWALAMVMSGKVVGLMCG